MGIQKQLNTNSTNNNNRELVDDEGDICLPGFRFHPLDEELVGFYLLRKVEKKPMNIELIKEINVYKYDPWDLPKGSNGGEKEWYFFCRRGRKYRNSIRPNRVTGSGFWKATGIDRPIYDSDRTICIGLKKSLVYYRGSAGKGTKTEWMMHEFRLPPCYDDNRNNKQMDDKSLAQEAEVWTLCRILKRPPCYKKTLPEWREVPTRKSPPTMETSSGDSDHDIQSYISFQTPAINDHKPLSHNNHYKNNINHNHQQQHQQAANEMIIGQAVIMPSQVTPEPSSCSSFSGTLDVNEFINHGDWDDLRSVVDQFSVGDPFFFME